MPFYIKIIVAPDQSQIGTKFQLANGDNIVGRVSPPCSIKLEGTKVSKKHCNLFASGDSLTIEDLKSSNGIFLNGKQITKENLKEKDRIVIGDYTVEITVK